MLYSKDVIPEPTTIQSLIEAVAHPMGGSNEDLAKKMTSKLELEILL